MWSSYFFRDLLFDRLKLFRLLSLACEGFVDMWDDSSTGNGCFDECIEFFVTSDGELEMTWGDAFHFEILRCISCQFKHFCGEVLQDRGRIYCSSRTYSFST